MSKSATEYIHHILTELEFLEKESAISEDLFMRDEVLMRAFARSLEIIGEAIKMIPDDVKNNYSDIDWKSFAGLRDKLIHHYFGIDYQIVWDIVKNELPLLQKQLIEIQKNALV